MSDSLHWCIVGVPTPDWAKVVFPDLEADEAVDKLWEAVLRVCRITEDDPVGEWSEHIRQLEARADLLTRRQFDALRYEAPGTDLTLGLPEGHVWKGSEAHTPHGRTFNPNIPTEEIFTAPHRLRGDGVVTSTKPLILNQVLVDEFVLEVENGRVVNASATSGQEVLDQVLQQDDGASHFGEVALVPQSSLVASENLKWQHPLFDENDASHIALGRAFPISISDARDKTQEQLIDAGLNTSSVHEDFVVGSRQLNVHGVHKDGSETPLLRDSEWAIDP
jgi:aminopeptidase